jgi:hypothetical protein
MANTSTLDWGNLLIGQLAFYWDAHLRPRLDGLTDEEYFWNRSPGAGRSRPTPTEITAPTSVPAQTRRR